MPRSRNNEASFTDAFFALFQTTPVWVGPVVAAGVFAGLRWLLPWILSIPDTEDTFWKTLCTFGAGFASVAAPIVAGGVLLIWLVAEFQKWKDRDRVDRQTGIDSIRALDWREFERLLSEAFKRQGYSVEQLGGAGPDGGVDLRLTKGDEITLVQCKHWQRQNVGVKVVRELLGVIASAGASAGVVVTSGDFTSDAFEFSRNNPITLVGGEELEKMIRDAQRSSVVKRSTAKELQPSEEPACPVCDSAMKLRTARRGPNAGSQFWGCSRYPNCRGTRDFSTES